jgi:hypothetical protein
MSREDSQSQEENTFSLSKLKQVKRKRTLLHPSAHHHSVASLYLSTYKAQKESEIRKSLYILRVHFHN